MRRSNLMVVLFAFVLLVAAPALFAATTAADVDTQTSIVKQTPSKVCNPKKPITCRASELDMAQSVAQPELSQWLTTKAPATAKPAPKLGLEQGRICCPPKWLCKSPVG